jgi:hypothetical protein
VRPPPTGVPGATLREAALVARSRTSASRVAVKQSRPEARTCLGRPRVGTAQAGRVNCWACRVAPPLEAVCPNAAPSLCPPSWLRSFPLTLDLSPILARSSMWLDRGMAARSCAACDAAARSRQPHRRSRVSLGKRVQQVRQASTGRTSSTREEEARLPIKREQAGASQCRMALASPTR